MAARGNRLACSLRTVDGCQGSFDAYPGDAPGSVVRVDPIKWDREPQKPVQEAAFTIIGDLGMTGQVILVNQYQWRDLSDAKLEKFFYAAILWGKSPFKVIEDAKLILKREKK